MMQVKPVKSNLNNKVLFIGKRLKLQLYIFFECKVTNDLIFFISVFILTIFSKVILTIIKSNFRYFVNNFQHLLLIERLSQKLTDYASI
jgi:uncharacterized membrane protein